MIHQQLIAELERLRKAYIEGDLSPETYINRLQDAIEKFWASKK